jgi:peptide/nickel transport system permease protein
MIPYLLRRALVAVLLMFIVSSGALLLAELAPGDFTVELARPGVSAETMARERARLGLDQPLLTQYLTWLRRVVRLDLGTSLRYGRPVAGLVAERAANTALLAVAALALATIVGIGLGVISGSRPRERLTVLIRAAAIVGISLPPLLTSLLLAFAAARTGWFPIGGMTSVAGLETGLLDGPGALARMADLMWHLALPALALALPIGASLERMQSQAMVETLGEPFVTAARARGIPERRVLWKHALRVAIRPVAGVYGLIAGSLLSGSFAVEIVASWPGLGRLTYEALTARDVYLVAGCAAAGSAFLAVGSLLSDVILAWADPRIRR